MDENLLPEEVQRAVDRLQTLRKGASTDFTLHGGNSVSARRAWVDGMIAYIAMSRPEIGEKLSAMLREVAG